MEPATIKSILDDAIDARLDKMFGDKDDVLRQLTKFSLLHDDPFSNEEVKATIAQMRAINTKMDYLLRDLQSTLDICGNIVLLDSIENV